MADVLHGGLGARHLACGARFRLRAPARRRHRLPRQAAEALGHGPHASCPPWPMPQGPLSSTRIRRELQDGYPERATAELGRPWTIRGTVSHGDKRGRTIGFPTANIPLGRHLEPARGVYAVTVRLPDGSVRPGVANIGRRPTVSERSRKPARGAYLRLRRAISTAPSSAVALHAYIRPEQKFPDLDALKAQIAADAAEARRILDRACPRAPIVRRMARVYRRRRELPARRSR